jgi:hypothetical protein
MVVRLSKVAVARDRDRWCRRCVRDWLLAPAPGKDGRAVIVVLLAVANGIAGLT